jgi:hypothetical protein
MLGFRGLPRLRGAGSPPDLKLLNVPLGLLFNSFA